MHAGHIDYIVNGVLHYPHKFLATVLKAGYILLLDIK